MAFYTFQSPAAEVLGNDGNNGGDDIFIASNLNLNAGDRAIGGAGTDELQYFADSTLTGSGPLGVGARDFSGFVLDSIELFTVTNDAGRQINFDLSSTLNPLTEVRASNSTAAIAFDQLTSLANVRLIRQTNVTTADVFVGYQAAVLAGQSNINLTLDNTNGDLVRIGTSTATLGAVTNSGVEQVTLQGVGGNSTIRQLDTNLTTLILADSAGAFDITITDALNTTVRTITSQTDGDVDLGWENNTVGVTYTGANLVNGVASTGVNRVGGGSGDDIITTFGGNDVIRAAGGNDTVDAGEGVNVAYTGTGNNSVTTGAGRDTIYAQGNIDTINSGFGGDVIDMTANTGRVVVNAGGGDDAVIATGGAFNASIGNDILAFGDGSFDALFVDGGTTDGQYFQVTGLEQLVITTAGNTVLAGNAENAGIRAIYLASGSAAGTGNDNVNASAFDAPLLITSFSGNGPVAAAVDADGRLVADTDGDGVDELGFIGRLNNFVAGGGNDTVTTGDGSDYFLFRGDNNLTDADRLDGGAESGSQFGGTVDGLVLEGDTTISGATAAIRNIEYITLESANGSIYDGPGSVVDGNQYNITLSNLNAPSVGQRMTINGNALVNGSTTPGIASEDAIINAGAVTAFQLSIITGAGDDQVTTSQAGDIVNTQDGDDFILDGGAGNDEIQSGLGDDTVVLTAGNNVVADVGGINTITLGTGQDTVAGLGATGEETILAGTELRATDTLVDFGGIDTVVIGGRNYNDNNFAGVNALGRTGDQGFEFLNVSGAFTYTLGANAQRAGFATITATDNANSFIDVSQFTRAVRVDLSAGGNDVVNLGSPAALATTTDAEFIVNGNPGGIRFADGVALDFVGQGGRADLTGNANLVLAGTTGNVNINGGSGTDVLRVEGSELTTADQFRGNGGLDVIQLDNTNGTVNAAVSLRLVTGVERYEFVDDGDVVAPPGAFDQNDNVLTFADAAANTITTLNRITVDASRLTDSQDSLTINLDGSLLDADFAFNIRGSSTDTTLVKSNTGTNNNINFQGGSGIDTFIANGNDLGSTTIFNGNGGEDAIVQTGGFVTDDSYVSVSNVEILTAAPGFLNATLGAEASQSGLTTVRGTTGNDIVVLDPVFLLPGGRTLRMELGDGGVDSYNAGASAQAIVFATRMDFLAANDTLIGGTTAADVLEITTPLASSAGNANGVTGVETINVRLPGQTAVVTDTTLTIDTTTADVNGGRQTINAIETAPDNGSTQNDFNLNGQTATANLTVNSASGFDVIQTGNGNDIISTGAGDDQINARNGTNIVDAGTGDDDVITGNGVDTITLGTGSDTAQAGGNADRVSGGEGNDFIRGQGGDDVLSGDAGNDQIQGGIGADMLDGGAGNDTFYYQSRNESNLVAGGRDTIDFFVSGEDTIDALSVAEAIATYGAGAQVAFRGNQANFGDAQSVINDNDGIFDIVYQQDTNTLWFDLNDDGTLNADDLQIIVHVGSNVLNPTGELSGGDVLAGQTVGGGSYAAFDAVFPTF